MRIKIWSEDYLSISGAKFEYAYSYEYAFPESETQNQFGTCHCNDAHIHAVLQNMFIKGSEVTQIRILPKIQNTEMQSA